MARKKGGVALEGHRLWDLIRTKNAEKVLGKLGLK